MCASILDISLPFGSQPIWTAVVRLVNAAPSHRRNRVCATRTTMPFSLLALVPGTRIGVYDITMQIGAGGMGEAGKLTSGGL